MPRLFAISGVGAKGPACFLVEAEGARVMLDLGYGPEPGLWPDVSGIGRVDALLLSHAHRDHAGALELLPRIGHPRVYATDVVRALLPPNTAAESLPLNGTSHVCGIRVNTGRNGHAPGGVWLHLEIGDGVLYTGDFSVESAVYAFDPPPRAATVVLDASYGAYDAALGDALPAFDALFRAAPVLLPVPAGGRGPDIALHIARSGIGLPHIDDTVRSAIAALATQHRDCVKPAAVADLAAIARGAPPIDGSRGVMLATAADAASGEAARLVARWENERAPAIVFTGHVPRDTPAERLTRSGRARHLRWNVHPRLSDAARLVRETAARTVLPAFGDSCHLAHWRSAFSPAEVVLEGPARL